ncbi:arginine/ornithine transport system ATPase [alpha proteobacterium BAL199]|jgi:LAO/AO transport system kinase|nr:arginine/ornithine transport system ATPase [alpha proteobacterium BAL199]
MPGPEFTPSPSSGRRALSVDDYVAGVRAGDRATVARAITLVESRKAEHRAQAQDMLVRLLPHAGAAHRVGITGVPGVGKSTFIEALGTYLTGQGRKVAVLAVDPTSGRSGGSILGDKTRMTALGQDANAFIRPSPSAGTLGGVARATRESMVVVEAAGYDVVLVETVGVGQSEVTVAEMVDLFLVLMLPGAGDELQGIKKGILEIADLLVVNKADGDNRPRAMKAMREYKTALHILQPPDPNWTPRVLTCSALAQEGIDDVWKTVEEHRQALSQATVGGMDAFHAKRGGQQVRWMWAMVRDRLMTALEESPSVKARASALEAAVATGETTPALAAERLLEAFEAG